MSSGPRPESLSGLKAAMGCEAEAACQLAGTLRRAREAMERLDMGLLEAELGTARSQAERVARSGSARTTSAELAARAAGLSRGASLAEVLGTLGPAGQEMVVQARALFASLDSLSREIGALGIAARYGMGLWAHLAGLWRGPQTSYEPSGRTSLSMGSRYCRV